MGIKDYVTKQGFKGVIVPVSGGIDSALVATMSVDALGADRVKLIYLPTRFNSPDSLEDAKKLSDNLDSPLMVLSIDSIFETFDNTLRNELHKESFDIADENLQARIRANIVFYISNATGYLVLSCSNKSEAAVGYGTIYGDMAGGFAPIKDVLKTQVYQLARYRNDLNPVIPERILSRAPSAELNVDQKDQDVLPPYDILDAFINDYMVSNIPIENLTQRYGNEVVTKILRMIKGSEFKRKQAPVGPKISPRSFGKGWRMPIVNGFMPKGNTLGD
jgi:NAD+ synthase (glutamine-hydrolysing)